MTIEEYLECSYKPDREFVDGVVVERNLGTRRHARLQTIAASFLVTREALWGVYCLMGPRIRVADQRVRVPDVCAFLTGSDLDVPPFICLEILSPEDTLSGMLEKFEDYAAFGAPASG